VVITIAASLYVSGATDDALRAEPPIEAIVNEAWDLYYTPPALLRIPDQALCAKGSCRGRLRATSSVRAGRASSTGWTAAARTPS
jgi:hypothetical protein